MRNSVFVLFIIMLISVASCRSDFDFEPSAGQLTFSKDTVYLDTVFTNIGSSTYTLKVYNKSDKNISIPTVQLGKGNASKYRMTVDGMTGNGNQGKIFNNVELLAKDSLFIFIETTAEITDANPTDFLYTDQIQFGDGTKTQKVELVTLIQDAVFLYPQKNDDGTTETLPIGENQIYGFFLDENDPDHGNEYELTNEKPYVIYGYAAVSSGKTLNIHAGARLYFHADSGIIVAAGGTLNINGAPSTTDALENEVVFEGDRLEPMYSDIPGQWGAIWVTSQSTAHIDHLTLKNAVVGLLIENNSGEVTINNTQIYDCSNVGLLARNGTVTGKNVVINTAGQAALACNYGGTYNFTHSTFNNNWPSSSQAAVLLGNYIEGAQPQANPLIAANFNNCIIFGSNQVEMILDKDESAAFNYKFSNCLIKFNIDGIRDPSNPLYDFNNTALFSNCLISKNNSQFKPDFLDISTNKLVIGQESAAKEMADPAFTALAPADINNVARPAAPAKADIGAYQSILFED